MKLDEVLREVSDLRGQLQELRVRVEAFRTAFFLDSSLLLRRLKGRGLKIHGQNPPDRLLIPSDLSPELSSDFYERMKRYSFRLFLRDLVKTEGAFRPDDLTRYCSSRIADEYTQFLDSTGTVSRLRDNRYRLDRLEVSSFGPTLEWFVAQIFQREFACPAIFGVRFKETDSGGDYDVLAIWEGRLVYVEVKSSPPKSIEAPEIGAFFSRLYDLIPDVAFFFNDTHLRMKDKVLEIFRQEMERARGALAFSHPPEKLLDEMYHVNHRIYILNSKRDIVANFTTCLRDHLRTCGVKPVDRLSFYSPQ